MVVPKWLPALQCACLVLVLSAYTWECGPFVDLGALGQVEPSETRFLQEEDEYEVGNGPFADILRPHEMQPIYLLPLTNGLKQLLTFSVFGFDFKTKIKTGSAAKKVAGFFVSYVAKLAFICLALNSYVRDIQTFQRSRVYHPSFWQSSLLLLAVWCTSHNFSAALGLWGSFEIQSPRVIFAKDIERERYFSAGHLFGFFKIGFPFFLGGARWLQFPKQIYAILLVPYVLPYLLLYYSTIMLLGLWAIIFTKCMCLYKCIKLHVLLVVAGILFIVSFGHIRGVEECWERTWPFVYLFFVQMYARLFIPPLIAVLFGVFTRASPRSIFRGLGTCRHERLAGLEKQAVEQHEASGLLSGKLEMQQVDDGSSTEEEEDCRCLHAICAWLEKCARFCDWLLPQRKLHIDDTDRKTLLRLDWSRLSGDFKFNEECMNGLKQHRDELDQVTDELNDFSPFDEMDMQSGEELCVTPYGKGLVDVCMGRELLFDYDVNVEHAESLQYQLEHKDDENTIDDALVQVVLLSIRFIGDIALQQALTIWLVRTLWAHDFEGATEAMRITVSERTLAKYLGYLATMGETKLHEAMSMVWGL
ncbi:unnamed protein product [Effrenium voratum]|nr:unnamed protein product [Effrenium voratum]CAJ1429119.1 unnamed protein product [Effrenium voratum]